MFTPDYDSGPAALTVGRPASAERSAERGEALQTLLVVLAAIVIVGLAIAAFFHFSEKPVQPAGQVEQLWAYPIHRDSLVGGGNGSGATVKQPFDQLFLLTRVKVDNPGKIPIYIRDMSAEITLAQGETHTASAAGTSDFGRIFVAYPELAPHKMPPLLRETTIAPGTSAEGLVVFAYPITKEQWDTHSAFNVTISFIHQADIVLQTPAPSAP